MINSADFKVLGQIADIRQGRYLAKEEMAAERSAAHPIPVHGANGIIGWTDRAMYQTGVPLVTCRGSNSGMVLWAEGPLWVSNNAMAIIPHNGNLRFAYYCLVSSPPYEVVSGSAQPQITRAALSPKRVFWPDDDTQRRVSAALSALDDKIELNRRMNETLEAMAQAIFRDWFIDFGPVRRKMEGAHDPVAIMGGVTTDTARATELAALHPSDMSDLDVPAGWSVTTLEGYALLNPESWSNRNQPDRVRYVDLSNTKWGVIESVADLSWSEAPSRARRIARHGDTLVGTVRPGNGSYAYVGQNGLTASTGFAQLRPRAEHYRDFVYIAATRKENIERLSMLADGGAYPAVNPGLVAGTSVPEAPEEVIHEFAKLVSPIRQLIEQRKNENQTLAETRDYLLPRLMSGEVRVRDAEMVVSEVAA